MPFRPEWPGQVCSLGGVVAQWILDNTCHGPGDLQGQPSTLDDEMLAFVVEAWPKPDGAAGPEWLRLLMNGGRFGDGSGARCR